ncbi:hypothetical protein [uncultured Flavobacterium sp.]|mgnify:CR=1 FL=1|uniref:hypothetical protein n=1 Tax=uncultured Flavobacterium sp. TaxID=165435 RepID=UPI0025EFB3C6|nr:hypothetical protein [uncultured Flavobacterium sp.]
MILGRFYFTQTQNGNLLGEFSNNTSLGNSSESADINSLFDSNRKFLGYYRSTWFENGAQFLNLNIEEKGGTGGRILILRWHNPDGTIAFYGEGFLNADILIGNYWDREIQDRIGESLL